MIREKVIYVAEENAIIMKSYREYYVYKHGWSVQPTHRHYTQVVNIIFSQCYLNVLPFTKANVNS